MPDVKYNIRPIQKSDWRAIDDIQRASYPADAQEDINAMRCHWALSPETCFVAGDGARVDAYALSHPWTLKSPPPINIIYSSLPLRPDSLYLHDVAIHPGARNAGLASTLVTHVLKIAQQRGLSACSLISVQGSRGFWEKFGFHEVIDVPAGFFDAAHAHYRDHDCVYMMRG